MAEYGVPFAIDTPAGTVTFNPTGSQADGYYLTDVQGLDEPVLRVNVDSRPQLDGGILYDSFYGPRYPTLSGLLRFLTVGFGAVGGRRAAEDTLRGLLDSIKRADGTLRWTPNGSSERGLTVRLEQLQIGNQAGPLKTFQIALVAPNPNIYETSPQTIGSTALSGGGATAWLFPFSFPFTFGAASSGGQAVVSNAGNVAAYPTFHLTGAMSGVQITNQANGLLISLPNLVLGDSDFADIDCYAQTVTVNGAQGIQFLDVAASTFFTLAPGSSTLRLTATSFDSLASMAVNFANAWA